MILNNLKLFNFRNYREADVDFSPGTNVLFGRNGQGKTNILESIYYLAITKSFRTGGDSNLILNKENFFRIQGEFKSTQERLHRCSIAYLPSDGKRLVHNGQKIQKFSDYIGTVPVVLLAPSDLEISQGGPQHRRRFLDIMLSQASGLYLHNLIQYRRALKQRNSLLQENNPDPKLLRSWDDSLVQYGVELIEKRLEAIEILDSLIKESYLRLSGSADKTKLVYQRTFKYKPADELKEKFLEALDRSREKDRKYETTTTGPHRDDILFLLNGKPLRVVGSQGEHKTFVISLKMSEYFYLRQVQTEPPILLFDDIFGELDAGRIKNMIGELSDIGQVFITTTSAHFFEKVKDWEAQTSFFEIIDGNINQYDRIWQKQNQSIN